MKISIITPSYNKVDFIEHTLKSVLSQKGVYVEYIVIDAKSNDGTETILGKYTDRIKLVSEKDNGQSDAINKGLKMATGEIVAFLNADDIYEPGALQLVSDFFEKNPQKYWVYGKCRIINEKGQEVRKLITTYKNLIMKNYSYSKLIQENFISQPSVFWRRELIHEIGLFNENEHLCMDYEYWLRIGAKYDPAYLDSYLSSFRTYSQNKSTTQFHQQFKDDLRLATHFGAEYPFSVFIHKINSLKIRMVYSFMNLFRI